MSRRLLLEETSQRPYEPENVPAWKLALWRGWIAKSAYKETA